MSERFPSYGGYSVEEYFDLVARGDLTPDDRVELLDGVIVSEPPMEPSHASGNEAVVETLHRALAGRAYVREQKPLILGHLSAPEPDIAVLAGTYRDYVARHPTAALLVVEVSNTTLPQDRLSKSRIYAGAGIPEYWILNVRGDCLEVSRAPDVSRRIYTERRTLRRGARLAPVAFADVEIAVSDLMPWPPRLPE